MKRKRKYPKHISGVFINSGVCAFYLIGNMVLWVMEFREERKTSAVPNITVS